MSVVAVRQSCRRVAIVCIGATVAYMAVAALASALPDVERAPGARFWPAFLPDWPIALLVAVAALLVLCDTALWALSVSAARRERERLQRLASDWPHRAEARAAVAGGDQALRLESFHARALAGAAHLTWTAPAGTYDRILVLRSVEGFALAPGAARGQVVAYEGDESGFVDHGLEPDRVYFYTAFAEARGAGRWSPPAWAAVTTPPERLRDVALGRLWTLRR